MCTVVGLIYFFVLFFSTSLLLSSLTLVGGFTLDELVDKPWYNRCPPFSPPVRAFIFCRAYIGFTAFTLLVDFHRMYQVAIMTHALALSANQFFFCKEKPRACTLGET